MLLQIKFEYEAHTIVDNCLFNLVRKYSISMSEFSGFFLFRYNTQLQKQQKQQKQQKLRRNWREGIAAAVFTQFFPIITLGFLQLCG